MINIKHLVSRFHATMGALPCLTLGSDWRGQRFQDGAAWGWWGESAEKREMESTTDATLWPPEALCITMGCNVSHFNVSPIVEDSVCDKTATSAEKGEPRQTRSVVRLRQLLCPAAEFTLKRKAKAKINHLGYPNLCYHFFFLKRNINEALPH